MSEQIACPNCDAICPIEEIYCHVCGFNLRNIDSIQKDTLLMPDDGEPMPKLNLGGRAFVGKNMYLCLQVEESNQKLPLHFTQQVILGRGDHDEENGFIDLKPYDAASLGVSRKHLRLFRLNMTIMLEDLGTLNGTYLNGERLASGQSYVICDGDELRLGKLGFRVAFEENK